ncbi:chaperone modulatory protein CbpM [Meinhardsimonia xiamenensis]|jgi:chaperone modulatory protein CbpM|uniref:Chaperone modulatory protein CbpM n=1 Tax=Meinhardsimonia xiamenensis TaxID=990712 RepID=A0A1G9AHC7_9RHOB|nr:hypothetical protein [Meinhardsimonia xiamenensis]PRX35408.1 chaperone modulatory protein CbpM [Meinhardsimonia xiamenensis]SDK25960.1 chaperone modulatory protein CbpM [Meinhardsimonia xiamenensis]
MSRVYSIEELVAAIPGLTVARLRRLEASEVVRPMITDDAAPAYRAVDRARLELACHLGEVFDLNEDALGLVMDLVDRMHGLHAELDALLRAVAEQPEAVRRELGAAFLRHRWGRVE